MSQRVYNPQDLNPIEEPYRIRFEQLQNVFGDSCTIFVTDPDGFGRIVGAGVAKLDPETNDPTVVVRLKFSGHRPLEEEVIQEIWSHLSSGKTEDLSIIC